MTTPDPGSSRRVADSAVRAAPLRPLPEITDPHELVIEFLDYGPDDLGRRHFFAYWLDNNVGPACDQVGVRGQVFFTRADQFVDRNLLFSKKVRYL